MRRPRRTLAVLALVGALAACTGTAPAEVVRAERGDAAPSGAPAASPAAGTTLTEVDGGPQYYARRAGSLPTDPSYFPTFVWFESLRGPEDVAKDQAAGLNGYVALTRDSDLELARRTGMSVFAQADEWAADPAARRAEALDGWLLGDEVDMTQGPGKGYRTMAAAARSVPADDGRLRYANYGKGVAFWETEQEAQRFVREFQDVVSVDLYWYTDPNICSAGEGGALLGRGQALSEGDCRKAVNYGASVERVRELLGAGDGAADRPVWNFVEVGHPFTEEDAPSITPPQLAAAVWHSLIAGARGVVYFNHSFGGPCQTQHALREECYADVRGAVTETNARIRELAPVLNAPFLAGYVDAPRGVALTSKLHDGRVTVLAGASEAGRAQRTVRTLCAEDGEVEVLFEDRTVPLRDGAFTDEFDGETAVHTYRLPAACTPDV